MHMSLVVCLFCRIHKHLHCLLWSSLQHTVPKIYDEATPCFGNAFMHTISYLLWASEKQRRVNISLYNPTLAKSLPRNCHVDLR